MKLKTPGTDAAMLIARGGTLLILVGVFTLTDRILGLDRLWSVPATLVALGLWWRTELVWKIGTRRLLDAQQQPPLADERREPELGWTTDGAAGPYHPLPATPMMPLAARDRLQLDVFQGTAAIAFDRLLFTVMPGNDPTFAADQNEDHMPSDSDRASGYRRNLIRSVPRAECAAEELH